MGLRVQTGLRVGREKLTALPKLHRWWGRGGYPSQKTSPQFRRSFIFRQFSDLPTILRPIRTTSFLRSCFRCLKTTGPNLDSQMGLLS